MAKGAEFSTLNRVLFRSNRMLPVGTVVPTSARMLYFVAPMVVVLMTMPLVSVAISAPVSLLTRTSRVMPGTLDDCVGVAPGTAVLRGVAVFTGVDVLTTVGTFV